MKTFLRSITLAAAALALLSCSSVARLAYNNAPPLVVWYADDYLDLTGEQKDWLRERADRLLAWHRKSEMPAIRAWLMEALRLAQGPMSEAEVQGLYLSARASYRRTAEQVLPEMAELLAMATPEQAAALERRFAKDNAKIEKDLSKPLAERVRLRGKKLVEQTEDWIGSLTRDQMALLGAANADLVPIEDLWLADRKQRQAQVLRLLRARAGRDEVLRGLRRMVLEAEAWRDPAYLSQLKSREVAATRMVVALARTLTPQQRAALRKRLGGYLDDVNELMLEARSPLSSSS
jgi:hypothetical protein